jgi:2-polyprenyl-3-methyl-5-hydroxy-6-metoxy-1,4-benzoquinol methylase
MSNYKPDDFWETSHSSVPGAEVKLGSGVRHVGGGHSDREADALYRLRRLNAKRILAHASLPSNPKIFELGSGGGFWVNFFRSIAPALFLGSDISSTAVERLASNNPDSQFVCLKDGKSAWDQIFAQGPFDLCLGIDVLYHITDENIWQTSLNNLCANCKPGGWLLLADYFYEQPREAPSVVHVLHRPMQAYLDILDRHRFEVVQTQPIF